MSLRSKTKLILWCTDMEFKIHNGWVPDPNFAGKLLKRKKHRYYYKECVGIRLSRWRRRKLRQLSEAQNHRCAYCGKETHFDSGDSLDRATLEHVVPSCNPWQTNKDENLVMACSHCNGIRSNTNAMKFFNKIRCKPQPVMIAKQEGKWSKDPVKLAHQKVKQGRLLSLCWVLVHFWPKAVVPMIEYVPTNHVRPNYEQHINIIRARVYKEAA